MNWPQSQSPVVGILAFGSLMSDPGDVLAPLITKRLNVSTPFRVEFGRYSAMTRGGAPTLVPVTKGGAQINAKVLVLEKGITESEGVNLLWRRETRKEGREETYQAFKTPRAVRVRKLRDFAGLNVVLYTDFFASGKIRNPKAVNLARRAIKSVRSATNGKDGITYLIDAIHEGVETPLTEAYAEEIKKRTATKSLDEALAEVKRKLLSPSIVVG